MISTGAGYLEQLSYLTSNQRRKILQLPDSVQTRLISTIRKLSGQHDYKRIEVLLGKIDGGRLASVISELG